MWLQFFGQNLHFAINIFASLVFVGAGWLYFDSWRGLRSKLSLFRWLGFVAIGLSYLIQSTVIEQSALGHLIAGSFNDNLAIFLKLAGLITLIIVERADPILEKPKTSGILSKLIRQRKDTAVKSAKKTHQTTNVMWFAGFMVSLQWVSLFLAGYLAYLYWRRVYRGLENHIKPLYFVFTFVTLADFLDLASLLRNTSSPILLSIVRAFGVIWWLQLAVLLIAIAKLGLWTWWYLSKRIFTQLFMVFAGLMLAVYLLVSSGLTGMLISSVRSNRLSSLDSAVNVLDYALYSQKIITESVAQQAVADSKIQDAVVRSDRASLKNLTSDYLVAKNISNLIITDANGKVLLRAADSDAWGDSISGDLLVKRSLIGLNQSTISVLQGVGIPVVEVKSAVDVVVNGQIQGVVIATIELDSGFVDKVKSSTKLESAIYANNILTATTLTTPGNNEKLTGTKLTNKKITKQVLINGNNYHGEIVLNNQGMIGSILPIKDVDGSTIGMLVVAEPDSNILILAGKSIQTAFLITPVLILLSILPLAFITRKISRQLE